MYLPTLQLQLLEPITGRYDCGAYAAAMAADADSQGKWKLSGRRVRLASDEPIPDHNSPGLNIRQTADAIRLLTHGEVNLDSRWGANKVGWDRFVAQLKAGRWAHLCVTRGPLVDAGFGGSSTFRRTHGVLIGYDPVAKAPIMADPLIPHWVKVTWAALKRAAGAFPGAGFGFAAAAFTRLVGAIPAPPPLRYSVRFAGASFFAYSVNERLKISGRAARKFGGPTSAPCGAKREYSWPGHGNRELVEVTDDALKGKYVEPGATGVVLVVFRSGKWVPV